MTKLSVNVNKIATLRNTRSIGIPSVMKFSKIALDAGANGITVHPRPDQRHIRPADVYEISKLVHEYPDAEFNIEGNPFLEFEKYIRDVRPHQCTLVPDSNEQSTSDHGWDLSKDFDRLKPVVARLKGYGSRVSLFMDPIPDAMNRAQELGVDRIEFYTAPYAHGFAVGNSGAVNTFVSAAERAIELKLGINAGHDLNLENLPPFLKAVPGVLEVSIGHALIGDALEFGLAETVRKYLAACRPS